MSFCLSKYEKQTKKKPKKYILIYQLVFFICHLIFFSGLRAMNEPVLNTLRPLEEIEHESEEEEENNFDESAEGK